MSAETPRPVPDEQQPLLVSNGSASQDEENLRVTDEERIANVWKKLWYTVVILSGVLLLAMFIKGFIDADDTHVRRVCLRLPHFCIHEIFSLT
jgi:hypothetical protein